MAATDYASLAQELATLEGIITAVNFKSPPPKPPKPTEAVTFSHPLIANALNINVNPDQIQWAYGLNTQSFPSYGGEVVQILSAYVDDVTINGTVSSYRELETIYHWFIDYIQYATQGGNGLPTYNQQPVTFTYLARGWQFLIWPKSLPGFRYGTGVVAPTWSVTAAVKEPDATFVQQLTSVAKFNAENGNLITFGKATADFGSTGNLQDNPYASPDPNGKSTASVSKLITQDASSLQDTFSSFLSGSVSDSLTDSSLSGVTSSGKTSTTSATKVTTKKGTAKTK